MKSNRFRLFAIIIFFFLGANSGKTQIIQSIDVEGGRQFDKDEYVAWSGLKVSGVINDSLIELAKRNIKSQLNLRGYLDSQIDIKKNIFNSDSIYSITLKLMENSKYELGEVIIVELDSIPEQILKTIQPIFVSCSDFNQLPGKIIRSLELLEEMGYVFIAIEISSIMINSENFKKRADIYLKIRNTFKSYIDKIRINGNSKTKDYVILREVRISQGDLYEQSKINKIERYLYNLDYFETISPPEFYFENDKTKVLEITLTEKKTNKFDGALGYQPPANDNDQGNIVGFFNLNFRNLFGSGRGLAFEWKRLNPNVQEIKLKYFEPWMLNYPINGRTSFFQYQLDSSYIQRSIDIEIEYLVAENVSFLGGLESGSIIPGNNEYAVNRYFYSSCVSTLAKIKINKTDDIFYPKNGFEVNVGYSYLRKNYDFSKSSNPIQINNNLTLHKYEFDASVYWEILKHQVFAIQFSGRELQGDYINFTDLYKLGGYGNLRGYRENQFLGSKLYWSNIEYFIYIDKKNRFTLFTDIGYYEKISDRINEIPGTHGTKIGYGAGIGLDAAIGYLNVYYALGKGDRFSEGKIHFGLMNNF